MSTRTQADLFIETLAEVLEVERSRRAARLRLHHKSHANRFVHWLKGEFDTAGLASARRLQTAQVDYEAAQHLSNR